MYFRQVSRKHKPYLLIFMFLMRDEKEERKEQARSNKQTRQSNTAKQHSTPKVATFPRKNELPQVGLEPTTLYSRQSALPAELPRQHSRLCPNLTSHSTPDEQANHQLSVKEKAGVMKPPKTHVQYTIDTMNIQNQKNTLFSI